MTAFDELCDYLHLHYKRPRYFFLNSKGPKKVREIHDQDMLTRHRKIAEISLDKEGFATVKFPWYTWLSGSRRRLRKIVSIWNSRVFSAPHSQK